MRISFQNAQLMAVQVCNLHQDSDAGCMERYPTLSRKFQIGGPMHSINAHLQSVSCVTALFEQQWRACSAPSWLASRGAGEGPEPSTCTHLALDDLVVPLYLEHIACPAAHGAPGTMVAVAAGAVEGSVLHRQLRAVSGLTCEVHAAGEERDRSVRGSFPAGSLHTSWETKAQGIPLQNLRRLRRRRGRGASFCEEDSREWPKRTTEHNLCKQKPDFKSGRKLSMLSNFKPCRTLVSPSAKWGS